MIAMGSVRLCLIALLLIGSLPVDMCARHAEQEPSVAKKNVEEQDLQLTTTIDSYQYCAGDNDLDTIRMTLNLRFRNNGSNTVILYRGSDVVSRYLVDNGDQNVLNVSQTIFFSNEKLSFGEESYKKLFVALSKNSVYETSAQLMIPVIKHDGKKIPGAIGNGKYKLRIKVPTWPESLELAKELSDKWKERGILLYEPILSLPLSFEIIGNRRVIKCN